jgi:hypothetical protein
VKDKCGHTCSMSRQRQSLGAHPLPCSGERENRTRKRALFYVVSIARQRIDHCDLLHREV